MNTQELDDKGTVLDRIDPGGAKAIALEIGAGTLQGGERVALAGLLRRFAQEFVDTADDSPVAYGRELLLRASEHPTYGSVVLGVLGLSDLAETES